MIKTVSRRFVRISFQLTNRDLVVPKKLVYTLTIKVHPLRQTPTELFAPSSCRRKPACRQIATRGGMNQDWIPDSAGMTDQKDN
jgi:hypothetical protein